MIQDFVQKVCRISQGHQGMLLPKSPFTVQVAVTESLQCARDSAKHFR